jgi:hypothetical protein
MIAAEKFASFRAVLGLRVSWPFIVIQVFYGITAKGELQQTLQVEAAQSPLSTSFTLKDAS